MNYKVNNMFIRDELDNTNKKEKVNNTLSSPLNKEKDLKVIDTDYIKKRGDYKGFEYNNCMISKNPLIKELKEKNISVWIDFKGDICIRIGDNITSFSNDNKAKRKLSTILKKDIKISNKSDLKDNIQPFIDLISVESEVFEPLCKAEFIKKGEVFELNKFKPTKYMDFTDTSYKEPKTILSLIFHLVNYKKDRLEYILNWLAYFWQTFKRPQVAIALQGVQGAGKGIFVTKVLEPLFGKYQSSTISNKTLKSDFQYTKLANKLFYNLDEITLEDMKNKKEIANFLKLLITSNTMTLEKKGIDAEDIYIKGLVLITSNNPKFLDIEPSDRRYTIFNTGKSMKMVHYLGFKNFSNLSKQIEAELEDFAKYLYNYKIDEKLANEPMETPEKQALIELSNDNYTLLALAITQKDLKFFEPIKDKDSTFFTTITNNFNKNIFAKRDITKAYNLIFNTSNSSRKVLAELKLRDSNIFNDDNIKQITGYPYFKLN